MTPDREKEVLKRLDDLETWVVRLTWIGGGAIGVLVLHVFFGVGT
jgi:hypothetical protein